MLVCCLNNSEEIILYSDNIYYNFQKRKAPFKKMLVYFLNNSEEIILYSDNIYYNFQKHRAPCTIFFI